MIAPFSACPHLCQRIFSHQWPVLNTKGDPNSGCAGARPASIGIWGDTSASPTALPCFILCDLCENKENILNIAQKNQLNYEDSRINALNRLYSKILEITRNYCLFCLLSEKYSYISDGHLYTNCLYTYNTNTRVKIEELKNRIIKQYYDSRTSV